MNNLILKFLQCWQVYFSMLTRCKNVLKKLSLPSYIKWSSGNNLNFNLNNVLNEIFLLFSRLFWIQSIFAKKIVGSILMTLTIRYFVRCFLKKYQIPRHTIYWWSKAETRSIYWFTTWLRARKSHKKLYLKDIPWCKRLKKTQF